MRFLTLPTYAYLVALIAILTACGIEEPLEEESNTSISANVEHLDYVIEYGHGQYYHQELDVTYTGDEISFSNPSGVFFPSWLSVRILGSEPDNPVRIQVTVTPGVTGYPGRPGNYQSIVRFSTQMSDGSGKSHVDVPVNFRLYDGILDFPDTSRTTEIRNLDAYSNSNIAAIGNVGTGGANGRYEASSDQPWLTLSSTSGTTPAAISYTADSINLAVGAHLATLTITDLDNGDRLIIPIAVRVQPHKIYVDDTGIAFTSTPNKSKLLATLRVSDNANAGVSYSVNSDSTWLTFSQRSTHTPSVVTITADPSQIAPGLHYATFTVYSPNDASITNTEVVRVGFYISDTDVTISSSTIVSGQVVSSASDPIRPYTYIAYGSSIIDIFHNYTGALVDTIDLTQEVPTIGPMLSGPDGDTLYVVDRDNTRIVKVNLNTQAFDSVLISDVGYLYSMSFSRLNGIPMILLPGKSVVHAITGSVLSEMPVSGNATQVYPYQYAATGISSNRVLEKTFGYYRYARLLEMDLVETPEISLSIEELDFDSSTSSNVTGCELVANHQGNQFYSACDFARIIVYDSLDATLDDLIYVFPNNQPTPSPANLVWLSESNLLVGLVDAQLMKMNISNPNDVVRTPVAIDLEAAALSHSYQAMQVSSDGLRVVGSHAQSLPAAYRISFTSLPD